MVETLARFRRQSVLRWGLRALKLVGFIGLSALLAIFVWAKLVWASLLFAGFLALLAAGPHFDYWLCKYQFRKSPFYNDDLGITLTQDAYSCVGPRSQTKLAWSAFTKARRFTDGFLVFIDAHSPIWLPDSALQAGGPQEVESILRSQVKDYAVA